MSTHHWVKLQGDQDRCAFCDAVTEPDGSYYGGACPETRGMSEAREALEAEQAKNAKLRAEVERLDEEAQKCVNCCGTGGELDQLAAALKTARADGAGLAASLSAVMAEIDCAVEQGRLPLDRDWCGFVEARAWIDRALAAKDEEGE